MSVMAGVRERPRAAAIAIHVAGGHDLDRRAVEQALDQDGLTAVVASSTDSNGHGQPDVVVVTAVRWAADVRALAHGHPGVALVAIVDRPSAAATRRLLEAGAAGVVDRRNWNRTLGPVVRAVLAGQICVPGTATAAVEPPALTLRERQVLALMVRGLSNRQIAEELYLSESTVKSHAVTAFRRLGVNSRREAVGAVLGSGDALRRSVMLSHPSATN